MLKYEYDALFIFVWFVLVCVCVFYHRLGQEVERGTHWINLSQWGKDPTPVFMMGIY